MKPVRLFVTWYEKKINIGKLPMTASEGSCHIRGGNRRSGNYSAKEFPFSK